MKTSVRYPPNASKGLGHLKAHNNDIEIFVEDISAPNLWLMLLRNYLPHGIRLTSVTVLGSKERVIQACRGDQAIDNRRKLYIIDGDLDLLQGRQKPRLKYLYRLRSYCVENYLLDESAVVSAIMILNPDVSEHAIGRGISLNGWLGRNRVLLSSLFTCYAVTNELRKEEQTVKFSVFRLFVNDRDHFELSKSKIIKRTVGLYRLVRKNHSSTMTREIFRRVRGNANKMGIERFVSAKDYIFPGIYKTVQGKFHLNINFVSFNVLIAECMNGTSDPYLRRRLSQICS